MRESMFSVSFPGCHPDCVICRGHFPEIKMPSSMAVIVIFTILILLQFQPLKCLHTSLIECLTKQVNNIIDVLRAYKKTISRCMWIGDSFLYSSEYLFFRIVSCYESWLESLFLKLEMTRAQLKWLKFIFNIEIMQWLENDSDLSR